MTARQGLTGVAILSVIGVAVVVLNRVERPTDSAADPLDTPSTSTAPELAPSSLALDVSALDPERAYLSIVVDDADLHDRVIGLLTHADGAQAARGSARLSSHISTQGRAWSGPQRPVYADTVAARGGERSQAGVCISVTGTARTPRGGQLFPRWSQHPASLVVRREVRGYPNAIALDVARQSGAMTPAFVPVRTFLNGVDQGNYVRVEHVSRRGWGRSHFGHDDFLMFIDRSQSHRRPQ